MHRRKIRLFIFVTAMSLGAVPMSGVISAGQIGLINAYAQEADHKAGTDQPVQVEGLEQAWQNHIYASDSRNQFYYLTRTTENYKPVTKVMRYDLDEQKTTQVSEISGSICVYYHDDALYYTGTGVTVNMNRIDLQTGETTQIFSKKSVNSGICCIGVDDLERYYVSVNAGQVYVFDKNGEKTAESDDKMNVKEFQGFDASNGNIYFRSLSNWYYWGYDHDMACLKVGRLEDDHTIRYSEKNVTYFYQDYFYTHYGNAEFLNGRYLADLSSFMNGTLYILDSKTIDPADVTDTTTTITLETNGVNVSGANLTDANSVKGVFKSFQSEYSNHVDVSSVGTKCAYHEKTDTLYVATDPSVITAYSLEENKEIGTLKLQHAIYKMMQVDGHVVVIEKENGHFYVETPDCVRPSEITITGENTLFAGDHGSCQVELNSRLQVPYTLESSDPSVVSVSQNKSLSAWKAGEAAIRVKTDDGKLKAEMKVTVQDEKGQNPGTSQFSAGSYVSNAGEHQYSTYGKLITSYLTETDGKQLMRVAKNKAGSVDVEYLDQSGQVTGRKTIEKELSYFCGFYAGTDAYYLVFGQNNPEESDDVEVLRVVRYSKEWERIGECPIRGINTCIPCESGSLRMAEAKGNLYIHTCHQMYQGSDGLRHQSNMTFVIQEDDMSLTDAYTDVRNLSAGYVSHSFNQFIRTDGDSIFRVDHGDATPRGIAFTQTKTGDSVSKPSEYGSLVRFKSGTGNYTGASIGGYEISDSSHLVAYNMDAGSSRKVRNVYIAAKEKDRWKTAVRQITNYADDGTVTCGTPQLVKIDSWHFLLLWTETNSKDHTSACCMVQLDSEGNAVSEIKRTNMKMSDCQPIVRSDGTVSWYVTDQEGLSLYTVNPYILDQVKDTCLVSFNTNGKGMKPDAVMIGKGKVLTAPEAPTEKNYIFEGWYTDSACREAYDFTKPIESDMMLYAKWTHVCAKGHTWEEGRVTKAPTCTEQGEKIRFCSVCGDEKTVTVPAAGHHYQLIKVEDGLADVKCADCGKEVTGKVPTGYRAYWKKAESSGYYYSGIPNDLEDPDTDSVAYLISGLSYSASSDQTLDEFVVESSDPENCKVDMSHRQIHFSRRGSYTITVYPKFNPTLKKEYTFVVAKPVQAVDLKPDKETVFAGKTVQLTAEAEGGKGTLTYRFVQIGADGSEKVLQESTERTYEFSAGAAGEYTIRTDVIDEGDSYKVTSSDTRSIHVTKPELVTRDHKSVQSAGPIIFGKKTAEIEVSGAVFVRNDTKEEVSGTFCFDNPDQVLSAGTHEVSWTFKPDNPDYYDIVRGSFPVEVKKAEQPAIIPPERISVPYSEATLSEKLLAEYPDWSFADSDLDKDLEPGKENSFTAVYHGEDAGNYKHESRKITVIRSSCEHEKATEMTGKVEPTCVEDGYTGDLYCSECGELMESGVVIPAHGHHAADAVRENEVNPSCAKEGSYDLVVYCGSCGEEISRETHFTEVTGEHEFGDWKMVRKADYTRDGLRQKTCVTCGETISEVIPMLQQLSVGKAKVNRIKDCIYSGKRIAPSIRVTFGNEVLKAGKDYTVSFNNNQKVGTAAVIITGKGRYTGTKTVTFKIIPKGTKLSKLTAKKAGFQATWEKQSVQTTGYQLLFSKNKAFKTGNVTRTIGKNTTVSRNEKKLKKGSRYYVKVRTYKKVGNQTYYSSWSKVKSVVVR